jgi:hypothetical protein
MFCVVTFSYFISCFTLMLTVAIMTLYQVMTYEHCFDCDLVFISFPFLQWGGCAVWDWCFIVGPFVLWVLLCFNVQLSLNVRLQFSAIQQIMANTLVKFKFKSGLQHYVLESQPNNSKLHNLMLRTESDYDFGSEIRIEIQRSYAVEW